MAMNKRKQHQEALFVDAAGRDAWLSAFLFLGIVWCAALLDPAVEASLGQTSD